MNKLTRRVVWLGSLLLVVAALTAVTALHGTTPTTTFAHDSHHGTPTPTPTTPPLMITTTSLPNGNLCASYSAYITANKGGGSSLDTWTIVSGGASGRTDDSDVLWDRVHRRVRHAHEGANQRVHRPGPG
jgi:hypothetical protein